MVAIWWSQTGMRHALAALRGPGQTTHVHSHSQTCCNWRGWRRAVVVVCCVVQRLCEGVLVIMPLLPNGGVCVQWLYPRWGYAIIGLLQGGWCPPPPPSSELARARIGWALSPAPPLLSQSPKCSAAVWWWPVCSCCQVCGCSAYTVCCCMMHHTYLYSILYISLLYCYIKVVLIAVSAVVAGLPNNNSCSQPLRHW